MMRSEVVAGRAVNLITDQDVIPIQRGGTGATDAKTARVNLDVLGLNEVDPVSILTAPVFGSGLESSTWVIIDTDVSTAGVDGLFFKDATNGHQVRLYHSAHPIPADSSVIIPTGGGRLLFFPVIATAAGAMLYSSGSADPPAVQFAIGASGKLLKSTGSAPAWADAATAKVDLAAQSAVIAATNLITGAAGQYLITVIQTVTTIAVGTLLTTLRWTDENGAQSATPATGLSLAGTGTDQGQVVVYAASGNITYETSLAGLIGTPGYSLHISALKL